MQPMPAPTPVPPRAALLAHLGAAVAAAVATGDLEGARVVHEAIGKLLALPSDGAAPVVDLDVERRRRGR
jgi:hypothetical protein